MKKLRETGLEIIYYSAATVSGAFSRFSRPFQDLLPRWSGLGVIFQGFGRPTSVPEGIEFSNYLVGEKSIYLLLEDFELCAEHIW